MAYKITLQNLKKYLTNKGWRIEDFTDKGYRIKATFDSQDFDIIIPKYETLPDYDIRINELMASLGSIEQRNPNKIIEEIENIGFDILQVRLLSDKQSSYGTISLKI